MSLAIRSARPDGQRAGLCAGARTGGLREAHCRSGCHAKSRSPPRCFRRSRGCSATSREWNGEPAGFAVWFFNFSTFRGRHGIYLEDIFVRPAFRRRGIGKALLTRLAQRCVDEGYAPLRMGGARLERAGDRILSFARRRDHVRVENLPPQWASAAGFCRRRKMGLKPPAGPQKGERWSVLNLL